MRKLDARSALKVRGSGGFNRRVFRSGRLDAESDEARDHADRLLAEVDAASPRVADQKITIDIQGRALVAFDCCRAHRGLVADRVPGNVIIRRIDGNRSDIDRPIGGYGVVLGESCDAVGDQVENDRRVTGPGGRGC
jgi:hypothetical protein